VTPQRSRDAYVNVHVRPEDPFIENGPVLHVKESVEVKLECVARGGKPPAKINWYDQRGNLINDATYRSFKMRDSKLFEARSVMTFTPRREDHNATFRCEAWNEAADNLRPALARLFVQYAPSVTVTPVRPGMIQEGDKAAFHCTAVSNPRVYEHSYKWYIDSQEIPGQRGFYYEIFNVTRAYHDKQVRCSVENELGVAMGLKSIEVKYGPTFLYHPHTESGDRLATITLHCVVDSNPQPQYYWTKDSSREVIHREQNITIRIDESTTGSYYCHGETLGYSTITSRPAEVLMTGRPKISSFPSQSGVVGENVHINCAAISIPEHKRVAWRYHGSELDDSNNHYRIINSPIQHGVRSTLIIKQALDTDFGPYTCAIENSHGVSEIRIQLEQRKPFPLQITLIAIFAGVILVLLVTILVILFRRRICCYDQDGDKVSGTSTDSSALANNVILKVNNMVTSDDSSLKLGHRDLATPSQTGSNELDSMGQPWDSGSSQDFRNNTTTQLFRHNSDLEPDFPPKPDVISTGYFPYAQYVRDYNPPATPMMQPANGGPGVPPGGVGPAGTPVQLSGQESHMYSTIPNKRQPTSLLNVTDPRYSATYGNPLLRQTNTAPRGMQYSTFMPGPVAPPQVPNSTYSSTTLGSIPGSNLGNNSQHHQTFVSLPMSSRTAPLSSTSQQSSTTPDSSTSNIMACLPEDCQPNGHLSNLNVNATPSPPPAPTPPSTAMSSTTAIYARVNPNLKRDKTNNNNFTSTFAPPLQQQQAPPINSISTAAVTTTNSTSPSLLPPTTSAPLPPSSAALGDQKQIPGLINSSVTNGCVRHSQQQPPRSILAGNSNSNGLQRPTQPPVTNTGGHQLHTINSTVGTHV